MTTAKAARLTIAINVMAMGLLLLQPRSARARQDSSPGQVSASPMIEAVSDTLAFIRWTTPNPGGTILHHAIVRYGKDPNHLDLTAESPTRINPGHSEMVFRVRMHDLEPGTTYYYKVSSQQANGNSDPATSGVNQFTTRPTNSISANK
jgi:phosphodiesterase/alkaline phosphatase D-like protein